uniref:Artemin a n=1 Tax=Scophthalmus maximus TaxID=52904 RepID=A0A8D3BNV6_SCOMX
MYVCEVVHVPVSKGQSRHPFTKLLKASEWIRNVQRIFGSIKLLTIQVLHVCFVFPKGEWSLIQEEEIHQGRWRRSSRDPNPTRTSRRNRKKTKSTRDCHLERKEMRVRDLGLGYDSDEIVLFKYCVGTCHSSRRNYDLALKTLMDTGSISTKKVSSHPCCRPTRYETVSFMDTQTTWQTIKWLSAANCSCLG